MLPDWPICRTLSATQNATHLKKQDTPTVPTISLFLLIDSRPEGPSCDYPVTFAKSPPLHDLIKPFILI